MDPLATPTDLAAVALGQIPEATALDLLGRASEIIRGYCGWWIAGAEAKTVTLDGNGRDLLLLPAMHLTAVASVTVNGELLTPDSGYEWSESGVLERIGGCWPTKRRSITVTFTAGHTPSPRDVVAVCTGWVTKILGMPGGATQVRLGSLSLGQSLTAGGGLDDYDKAILSRYKLP